MKLIKIIISSLIFTLLCTLNVIAQAKENPLAILADELDSKPTSTPELDNFQRLEIQLDEYDQQRAQHKKEEIEQEQEQRKKEILSKTNPTPHPDLLACESLQEENTKIFHYIKTLQSNWKKFDGELTIQIRELSYMNNSMRGTKKQVFVNSDLEWIKSLNVNVERTKKSYESDMKRYNDNIGVEKNNSVCNVKKECNVNNKDIKKFIAFCKKWQSDKNDELKKIDKFAKEKQQKLLAIYINTINQIKKLQEKRSYEFKIKNGKI